MRERCNQEMPGMAAGAGMLVFIVAAFSSTPA